MNICTARDACVSPWRLPRLAPWQVGTCSRRRLGKAFDGWQWMPWLINFVPSKTPRRSTVSVTRRGWRLKSWRRQSALSGPAPRSLILRAKSIIGCAARGASGESFEAIVAAGPRSALPHARPTSRRIGKNELVVLDLGAILRHYCSDLTRTVHVGRAPSRVRRWYQAVLEAQTAARGRAEIRRNLLVRWMLRPEACCGGAGSVDTLSTAQAMASGWKYTKTRGWLGGKRRSWRLAA